MEGGHIKLISLSLRLRLRRFDVLRHRRIKLCFDGARDSAELHSAAGCFFSHSTYFDESRLARFAFPAAPPPRLPRPAVPLRAPSAPHRRPGLRRTASRSHRTRGNRVVRQPRGIAEIERDLLDRRDRRRKRLTKEFNGRANPAIAARPTQLRDARPSR
jgi:hypothetical protein